MVRAFSHVVFIFYRYVAHSCNFFLFPTTFGTLDSEFSFQASSVQFLNQYGFDYNKVWHWGRETGWLYRLSGPWISYPVPILLAHVKPDKVSFCSTTLLRGCLDCHLVLFLSLVSQKRNPIYEWRTGEENHTHPDQEVEDPQVKPVSLGALWGLCFWCVSAFPVGLQRVVWPHTPSPLWGSAKHDSLMH